MGVATLALCTGQGLVHNWPLRCLTVLLYPAAWQISVNDCHPWESARHTGKSIGNTVLSCPMGQDKCTLHGYLQAMWGGGGDCGALHICPIVLHAQMDPLGKPNGL